MDRNASKASLDAQVNSKVIDTLRDTSNIMPIFGKLHYSMLQGGVNSITDVKTNLLRTNSTQKLSKNRYPGYARSNGKP